MKRDRLKSQKDEQLLNNKMKLLSQEEKKVAKRLEADTKYQENVERIRVSVLKNKEMVEEAKRIKELQLEEQKMQNHQKMNEIRNSLRNWRTNLIEKRQNEGIKVKIEKNEIEKLIQIKKDENQLKNRLIHDKVQNDALLKEQKRKKEEYDKKLKMKKELEQKIKAEIEKKSKIDQNINNYQEKSIEIVQRINTLDIDLSTAKSVTKHQRRPSYCNTSTSTTKKKLGII